MTTIDLHLFLTSYTLAVAVVTVVTYLRHRELRDGVEAVVALLLIPCSAATGAYLDPDRTYWGLLKYLGQERDSSTIAAVLMGIGAALVWFAGLTRSMRAISGTQHGVGATLLRVISLVLVVGCGQAFLWKDILGITRHHVAVYDRQFVIEKIADLDDEPLRLVVDDDDSVLVCHDYFKKHGAMGGAILRFSWDAKTARYQSRVVVETPFLIRPYGLAVRNGDIYVSRAGFNPHATLGTIRYDASGAITQLKDLDGDGYFEYADDVIANLPGIRAPDTMQQNNGIEFASDGSLFVTCAGASDRTPDEHPWGGTILRYGPDWGEPVVFARGFRNPWEVVISPDGELFGTDNDIDTNPGDEINHIVEGGHYGHPFVIPGEKGVEDVGFRDPLVVGERESVFLGMAFASSESEPASQRGALYVTDFRRNRVLRYELARRGDTFDVVRSEPFASIPTPVDIAMSKRGDIFVISRRAKKLYRIRPVKHSVPG